MLGGGIVVLGALLLLMPRGQERAVQPPDLTGCYEAAGAPKIEIARSNLRVLQQPALAFPYKVEFQKGWTLSLDDSLDLVEQGGVLSLESRTGHGQFVGFTHEGELPQPIPGFELYEKSGAFSVRYARSGTRCGT